MDGVVLLEADPAVIITQIYERDQVRREETDVAVFMTKEHQQAEAICNELNVPLEILNSPTLEEFVNSVRHLLNGVKRNRRKNI